MQYTVVKSKDIEEFTEQVSGLLADGWTLQGGIFVVPGHTTGFHHFQAMTHPGTPPSAPVNVEPESFEP